MFEVGNVVAPGNYPTAIDPTFRAVPFWLDPLLYAPGAAPDYLVADLELTDGWAELLVIPGSINGTSTGTRRADRSPARTLGRRPADVRPARRCCGG